MPPKRKALDSTPLNESTHLSKRLKATRKRNLAWASVPNTPHVERNTGTPSFPPRLVSQSAVPLRNAAIPATTTATTKPTSPTLAESITSHAGGKGEQGRKKQRILAVDLPGIPNYHAVEVPFPCHTAKVSEYYLAEREADRRKVKTGGRLLRWNYRKNLVITNSPELVVHQNQTPRTMESSQTESDNISKPLQTPSGVI